MRPEKASKRAWKDFEDWVVSFFRKVGDSPRRTKSSGSVRSEPDVLTPYCSVEAKHTDSESFSLSDKIYNKLAIRSAHNDGIFLLVVETKGNKFFVVNATDFAILYKFYLSAVKDKEISKGEKLYSASKKKKESKSNVE